MGAHHVLVYRSIHEYGRVLVLTGVRSREPIVDLMRSRCSVGLVRRRGRRGYSGDLRRRDRRAVRPDRSDEEPLAPGVVVAGIVSVDDVDGCSPSCGSPRTQVQSGGDQEGCGCSGPSTTPREVLILQEVDDRGQRPPVDRPARMRPRTGWRTPASASIRRCSSASSKMVRVMTRSRRGRLRQGRPDVCLPVPRGRPVTRSRESAAAGATTSKQVAQACCRRLGVRSLPPLGARDHRSGRERSGLRQTGLSFR